MASPIPQIPVKLLSHAQKVCQLYKRAVRNAEAWNHDYAAFRYEAVVLRARFDANKNVKDLRKAKELLVNAQKELMDSWHPAQIFFPESPGGCAYGRFVQPPDYLLDHWHPTEKAMYPKYFATREKRKLEYVEFWNKQFPDAPKSWEEVYELNEKKWKELHHPKTWEEVNKRTYVP